MSEKKPRDKGKGCLFLRGATWWIKYSRHGHTYRESTKQTDPKKAEKFLDRRLAQLETGTFIGPQIERVKVSELAKDVLRDYRINGQKSIDDVTARWELHLKPTFGYLRAIEVDSTKITQYVDARMKEGAANATINRECAFLKRAFRLALQSTPPKVKSVPYIPMLAENNTRQGFVEYDQYRKLAEACLSELWLRTMLEVGHTYGWRDYSELLCMRVKQIDLAQRSIRLEPGTTKNGEGREVRMTDAVYHLLAACVDGKAANDHVFTRANGKPVKDFRGAWESVCEKAGTPGLLFHDLRRTAVRNLVNSGVSEKVAMTITGHKTRSVFDRYHIVSKADTDRALLKLESTQAAAQAKSDAVVLSPNGHKTVTNHSVEQPGVVVTAQTGNA